MIRKNISTFLNSSNLRWPPYYFVEQSLKKTKICDNYIVVKTKMYFSAKPMESRTHLDNQYCIMLSLWA